MIGTELGPYRLVSELGVGGMGTVYLAETAGGDRRAVKVIHPYLLGTPGYFKRFLREAEIGKRVEHENVVRTFDVDAIVQGDQHHHYLVMECVEGQTLRSLARELGRLPEELCRHVGRAIANGLEAIHAAGAVHRDLKPENVLITSDHVVKIMDLGVARLADEAVRISQTGQFLGSLLYAAPEQFGDLEPDARADFYALGLILYELATGRHASRGRDFAEIMRQRLEKTPHPAGQVNPQLSAYFEEVVRCLLVRDREERLDHFPEEDSEWWRSRARAIRARTNRPLRRVRVPRETALYGRSTELARLRELFELASARQGQVVLVEGEAGIGKTRLVDEFVGALEGDVNFLYGSYPPGGAATAAGAFSTAYREQLGEERAPQYLKETPLLAPAFDALLRGDAPPKDAERLTKDSLQTVFVHATRALARERPTVILIDDLHFAPEEGRALFAALSLAIPEHRVLLVGTARPGVPEEWIAEVERQPHASRVGLRRLGPKDLVELLEDSLRSERLARELAGQIAVKSDGNPFFVFEIIRGLREGQFLTQADDGSWVSTGVIDKIQIPSSVMELIAARIADLDEEQRDLLDVASCCGFEFDPGLVARAVGSERIPALKMFGQIERKHRLIRSAGRHCVFDHHQVQEALYGGLMAMLREEYHAALGEALEAQAPDVTGEVAVQLAEHFLKGGRGDRALRHLDAALDHLEQGYLTAEAVALAGAALAAPGLLDGRHRIRVLVRQARSLDMLASRAAQRAAAEEAVELAEACGEPALLGQARHAMGACLLNTADYDGACAQLEQARALAREAGDRGEEARVTGNLGNTYWWLGRYDESRERHERARELFRELGDRLGEARATGNLGHILEAEGRYEEARAHHERHLALARELGDRFGEAHALNTLGAVLDALGRPEEGLDLHRRHLELARSIGDRVGESRATGNLGIVYEIQGLFGKSQEQAERHLALAREIGDRVGVAQASGNLGLVLQAQGCYEEARALHEPALALAREHGLRRSEMILNANLGALFRQTGRLEEARARQEESLSLARALGHRKGQAVSHCSLGRIALDQDAPEEATAHFDAAARLAAEHGVAGVGVVALAWRARLPGGDAQAAGDRLAKVGPQADVASRMEAHYCLFVATDDRAHLEEAHRLLRHLHDHATRDHRASLLKNVALHREIARAWEAAG